VQQIACSLASDSDAVDEFSAMYVFTVLIASAALVRPAVHGDQFETNGMVIADCDKYCYTEFSSHVITVSARSCFL